MYEYANRLASKGHDICIYHSIKRPFKKSSTPAWLKQLIFSIRGVARPAWFPLDERVVCRIVPSITDTHIRDADIIMGTWWQMTYAISALSESKGRKFNLIQDYETWAGHQDKVDASFSLPVQPLAIARHLQELVSRKAPGVQAVHIPNAIDEKAFFLESPIEPRKQGSIIMLYSEEPRKGTKYGLEALRLVHEQFPGLQATLFGVYPPPSGLPGYISYLQRPGNLRGLYNASSIFISPSLGEGWALPPAEAMACGCAVVCTNIGGHLDYAIDNQSALLCETENPEQLADKILQLIRDDAYRQRIAKGGQSLIRTEFSWDRSVEKLEACFISSPEK